MTIDALTQNAEAARDLAYLEDLYQDTTQQLRDAIAAGMKAKRAVTALELLKTELEVRLGNIAFQMDVIRGAK